MCDKLKYRVVVLYKGWGFMGVPNPKSFHPSNPQKVSRSNPTFFTMPQIPNNCIPQIPNNFTSHIPNPKIPYNRPLIHVTYMVPCFTN